MKIHDQLQKNKTIAIWGDGYLAYTTMLTLQSLGLKFLVRPMQGKQSDPPQQYPNQGQKIAWSRTGNLPVLNPLSIEFQKDDRLLLSSLSPSIHFVCCPSHFQGRPYNENYRKIAQKLKENQNSPDGPRLVIFCSASGPGSLDRDFLDILQDQGSSWHVSVLFRSDWCVEDYFSQKMPVLAAATTKDAQDALCEIAGLLDWQLEWMGSIAEAEFVENARGALEFTLIGSLGQLATAFPEIDVKKLSNSILQKLRLSDVRVGMATGGYRMPRSFDSLLEESLSPEALSIFQEVRSVNYSSVLVFSEMLRRQGYHKVGILGIAPQNDFYQPPALLLAESLMRSGCEVGLHDPCMTELEHRFDLRDYHKIPWDSEAELDYDVLVLGAPHPCYKTVASQTFLKRIKKCKFVLDDYGAWKHLQNELDGIYHRTGDGTLKVLS